jgi:uncharacterized Zn finger protein (UPF0148 family)
MPTSFLVSLDYLMCGECGCVYAAPSELVRIKGELCCPNGHLTSYDKSGEDEDADPVKVIELRRELVHAIHRAEQAEARASENQKPATGRRRKSDAAGETT